MARLNRSSLACIGWLVSLGTASTVGCGLETQGTVPGGSSSGSPTTGGAGGMGSGGEAGTGGMGGIPGTGGMGGAGGAAGAGDGGGGTGGAPMVCNPGVDTQPCYSGPVNTPNIGICKAGTQTCLADGTGFGTCEGEVIPGDENCVMPGDEDCDTFADLMDTQDCKCTEPGATVACDTGMMGVCAAGTGTCSATGRDVENCMPTKTASPENCATAEDDDCNGMAAPACSGDTKWVPTAMEVSNTTKDDSIFAVAPAGNGEYLIAGFVNGTLAMDPLGVAGGGGSIYVAKLDAMGKRVWKNEYACTNYGTARGVGTDAAGNVYVAGEFSGTVKFDGNNDVMSASPSSDIFILKLDSTGKYVWHDRFGVNNHQVATDLAVNANGDLFITGYAINDAFSFGGMTYDPDGTDVFVAKFDKDKNHKWSRMFINTGTQRGRRLVLAPDGDVVIVGETDNNIDLGNGTISKGGNLDIIAAKYASADGAHKWSKLFGSTGDQVGRGIGLSSDGHILITGGFEGDITWKSMTTMTAIGTSDVYLAKLDVMNGNHLAHAQGGKSGTSTGTSIGADAAGNVTVFGYFTGAVDFGGQEITSTTGGANDLFLVKLNPTNLQPIWTKRYGKAGDQFGWDLTVASDGSNLLGGSFFTELEVPPMTPKASTGGADFVTILTNP